MKQRERAEVVRYCKFVDEVLTDTPDIIDTEYATYYQIDHVVGDEALLNKFPSEIKDNSHVVPRTEGVTQAMIINRVLKAQESFKKEAESKSAAQRLRSSSGPSSPQPQHVTSFWRQLGSWNINFQQWRTDVITQSYLRGFASRVIHGWNILGRVKELRLFGRLRKEKIGEEVDEDEDSTQEDLALHAYDCLTACKSTVQLWAPVGLEDIRVKTISGGLTNRLTKVSIAPELAKSLGQGVPSQLLVRHYGIGTDQFFDRENEHKIFKEFSERGIGPHLFGFFEGGRVEEFLLARTLTTEEFPQFLDKIGQNIANMHNCEMDLDRQPQVFENLFLWLDNARNVTSVDPEQRALLEKFDFALIESELIELKARLKALDSPILFCHNDLLAGNMMYDEEGDDLFFIDYEYGSYNYRGFEFGNHFCEWTLDYSLEEMPKFRIIPENYPTPEQQEQLFTAYLRQWKRLKAGGQAGVDINPTKEEIAVLAREANEYALAAQILWSLWGIIQSSSSEIQFGYLEFAHARLGEYFRLKALLDQKSASPVETIPEEGEETSA
eukprot:TRINITY_DN3477_c0_g1_i1.p1 TRINITY_DN3477_c0_g1~~TRINITY_DN3477_c0_g1_i1.p1  ORF type:complete len:615 (+),score=145.20 TRINITY_DN3477_c0_g1_i1:187-1845(+)